MKKILKTIGIIIVSLLVVVVICMGVVYIKLSTSFTNVESVDDQGLLYSMDYTAEYDNALMKLPVTFIKDFGCSAFTSFNEEGDVITARNYDLAHTDEDGNATGLNVVFQLHPKGKYASINFADAAWMSLIGVPYTAHALDDGNANRLFLAFLPYICMDGMNEKGLTVSILSLDLKEGESAVNQNESGKDTVTITEMLRLLLDECADVNEAISLAKSYNMTNLLGADFHLFVTDALGNSVVLEWRYNELYVTYQDAVTNFYVGFDDGEDCYYGEQLKEKFVKEENLTRNYLYGYGHGYARFNTIVEMLNGHIVNDETYQTSITDQEAMDTLESVAQDYDGTSLTSLTQYSVIYNSTDLTVDVCVMSNFDKHYTFTLEK